MRLGRALIATVASAATVVSFQGCGPSADDESTEAAAENGETVRHRYTVRGEIVALPSSERPLDELQIRHEAIPNYADREGNVYVNSKGVRGMSSMVMPFPPAAGLSLEGLEVGDKVEFVFETVWDDKYPTYSVTEITQLPPETELDYSTPAAEPPPAETPEGG